MIKQADENDILTIEEILLDAVLWMKKSKMQNQWNEDSIKWNFLSSDYQINNFYIDYQNGMPAACIAITDLDQKYWSEILPGKSLYIHKLAVKRAFSGKDISKELINYVKTLLLKNAVDSLRLDCDLQRKKLRMLYESEGFMYEATKKSENNYDMALYIWNR